MTGCNLSINACPKGAIMERKRKLQVDVSKCDSCAICAVACPRQAISFPLYSLTQIDEEMKSLISANSGFLQPRIILFACSGGISLLNELANKGLSYAANLMPIEVPCIGTVTPFIVLRAFDLGAAGVGLVSCPEKCQYGYDLNLLLENVQTTAKLLEIIGISSKRVHPIIAAGNGILDFHAQLQTFVEKVMQVGVHPLCGKNPSELKDSENPLFNLLKQIVDKLNTDKNVQIQDAKLPFGIVEVDNEKCSMCNLCASHCPTNAIIVKKEMDIVKLLFNYNLCIACDICLNGCPQKAINIKKSLELKRFENPISILMQDKMVECEQCKKAFLPKRQIEVISSRLSHRPKRYFQLISKHCPDCRAKAEELLKCL